jgi:hypothetical protein
MAASNADFCMILSGERKRGAQDNAVGTVFSKRSPDAVGAVRCASPIQNSSLKIDLYERTVTL